MLENKYEKCFAHIRGFEVVKQEHLKSHEKREDVVLPLRGTKYSAGYDFFLPYDVTLNPNEQKVI